MAGLIDRWRGRRSRGPVAFVLGGGGNLGSLQIGMLRALVEHGVRPDMVIGCSVGAINGAAYAADPTPSGVQHLEEMWLSVPEFDIFPAGWIPNPVQLARKGSALHSNEGLRRLVEFGLPVRRFDELAIPFECVATSVETADEHWFGTGDLIEPILASAALPAIYPVVSLHGGRFIDGGVVNDVPISRAIELGARHIYVLHVGNYDRPRPEPRRPLDVAIQAFWIARRHRFTRDLATVPTDIGVTILPPGEIPAVRYDEFSRSRDLMNQAYAAASAVLDREAGAAPVSRPAPISVEVDRESRERGRLWRVRWDAARRRINSGEPESVTPLEARRPTIAEGQVSK